MAMAEDDVELARRALETLASEGYEALLPLIHPDFVATVPPTLSVEPDTYRGPEGLRRYFESFYDAVDEIRFEPDDFIAAGGRVVIPMRVMVRGRGSGVEAAQRVVQVWELRDGLAIGVEVYPTLDEALAAVS
jgi:ketosteroid isomerase-like protein